MTYDPHASGLYSVDDSFTPNSFCGPTAIAALTGIPICTVEDAVLACRAASGTKGRKSRKAPNARVVGMLGSELIPTLARLGWSGTPTFTAIYRNERRKLRTVLWQRSANGTRDNTPLIICVTGHGIAVRGNYFVDTRFRTPTATALCPYLNKLVTLVIALTPCAPAL